MAKAGEINIFLNANTSNFDAGISKGIAGLKDFTKGFADIAGALFVFKGAVDTAAQFVETLVTQIGKLDEIGDIAARFDITANSVQRLRHTLKLSGSDVGSLNQIMSKLAVNLGDAASGKGSAVGALRSLGISAKDLQDLSLDQSFEKIARAISLVPEPTRRAAIATDIFGRSATEMMEVFTRKGVFDEAAKDIERFAANLDDVTAESVEKAAEAVDRLSMAWEGLKDEVAISAAPALASAADFMAGFIASLRDPSKRSEFVREFLIAPDESWRDNIDPAGKGQNRPHKPPPRITATMWNLSNESSVEAMRQSSEVMRLFNGWRDMQEFEFRDRMSGAALPPGGLPNLRQMFMGGNPDFERNSPNFSAPSGAAAIEAGTVAAYQAIQRAQRDDEAKRISKQQLEEQRKQTKTLDSIFQAMELGFDVVTIGLQS